MADFRYCINSSTIKTTPLLDQIAVAGEAGYAGIELWHDDLDAHVRGGGSLADIRNSLADNNLAVPTTIFLKGWWDTTGAIYERAMDEIKRRLAQAAEIGATHSISGPPLGLVDRAYGAAQYAKLLAVGREFGVKPVIEYLGFSVEMNTIDLAIEVMDGCGDPDATLVLDPFHCFRGDGGPESIARLTPQRISISHFNDAPAFPPCRLQHDPDRVYPGEGCIDLKRYCDLLRQIGYTSWLSLELFNRKLWAEDPREVAKIGLEKMRSVAES